MNRAAVLLFISVFLFSGELPAQTAEPARTVAIAKTERFYRTELYCGRSKPNGSLVSEEDWTSFLAETVTPRFPDGFTVLKGMGQYREKSGKIISEPSEVLIFLYPGRAKKESRAKIEEIRTAYIRRFEQESVLRVDFARRVSVSF